MELSVLGKYGPYPKAGGGTSSYLLKLKDMNVLLDAGEGSFSRLSKILAAENLDVIILTHSHSDHTCDMGIYNYYFESLSRMGKLERKPLVFLFDDGSSAIKIAASSQYFDKKYITGGLSVRFGDNLFEFFEMNHPVPSFAVKITSEQKTFTYSGDTNLCDNYLRLAKESDVVLADGCFLHSDWSEQKPHLSVRIISELSKKYGYKSIISHINPNYTEEDIVFEAKTYGGDCVIAQEGQTYRI